MKRASWGCCALALDSSGEPTAHPEYVGSGVAGGFGDEIGVNCTASYDEGANTTMISSR